MKAAVRVVRAVMSTVATGFGSGFQSAGHWERMSVWKVEGWLYQPTTWCTLTDCQDVAPPAYFGYLGCRETGKAVPLLAEALVRDGRTGLTVEARAKFIQASEGVNTVLDCLQKILQYCPESLPLEYARRWLQAEVARSQKGGEQHKNEHAAIRQC